MIFEKFMMILSDVAIDPFESNAPVPVPTAPTIPTAPPNAVDNNGALICTLLVVVPLVYLSAFMIGVFVLKKRKKAAQAQAQPYPEEPQPQPPYDGGEG